MIIQTFIDILFNGLTVATVETPHLRHAMCSVFVRVGSRHETKANSGVTHLLEHLFFRGSLTFRNSRKMNAQVEAVGGNLNAATMRDMSTFFSPSHASGVSTVLEVLGDMLTRPLLTQLAVEKKVIIEEMLDEVDGRGRDIDVENLCKRALYREHPLSYKIAGTIDSVRKLKAAHIKQHFKRYYGAANMALVVAGPVRRREIVRLAQKSFRYAPTGERVEETPPPALAFRKPGLHFVRLPEPQVEFRFAFPAVSEFHSDGLALSFIRRLLDDGLSSTLPFEIVERRGLAYSISATHDSFADAGSFDVDGACTSQNVLPLAEVLCSALQKLKLRRVSEALLQMHRQRYLMQLEFMRDSPSDLVGWVGSQILFRQPVSFEQRAHELKLLTPESVREVAKKYFRSSTLRLVAVGPGDAKPRLERALRVFERTLQ